MLLLESGGERSSDYWMKSAVTIISLYSKTLTAVYKSGRVGKMRKGRLEFRTWPARWQSESRREEWIFVQRCLSMWVHAYHPCGPLQSAVGTDRLKRSLSTVKSRATWNALLRVLRRLFLHLSRSVLYFTAAAWSRVRRVVWPHVALYTRGTRGAPI